MPLTLLPCDQCADGYWDAGSNGSCVRKLSHKNSCNYRQVEYPTILQSMLQLFENVLTSCTPTFLNVVCHGLHIN